MMDRNVSHYNLRPIQVDSEMPNPYVNNWTNRVKKNPRRKANRSGSSKYSENGNAPDEEEKDQAIANEELEYSDVTYNSSDLECLCNKILF